ncbi:hypothetical protein Afil01_02660 [Actinorhabdospora filicis]|uniref:Uncharacterized protein n=1 Tax=Actinorhabdospora filicis TaxID=1785913 RepID=A0A9W6SHC5_9ACTN|nr:hypothetical protein [Actinorhabdospora filicis]GLZ75459.1 hypothetical protein Afil01_02660 [Actinorhabdospora filicis]
MSYQYPGGYSVPQPHRFAPRIPADLPFVVRPSAGRVWGIMGGVLSLVMVPLLLCAVVPAIVSNGEYGFLLVMVVVCVGALAFIPVTMMLGGPTLACDEHGVWVRARKWPVRAVWLPWESIARVYTRRWLQEKVVAFQPHDPSAGQGGGAMTSMDTAMQRAYFGSRFTASVVFGDKREAEIMAALSHFARGRVYFG